MSFSGTTVASTVEPYLPIESRNGTLTLFQAVIEGLQSDCSLLLCLNFIHRLIAVKNVNSNFHVVSVISNRNLTTSLTDSL